MNIADIIKVRLKKKVNNVDWTKLSDDDSLYDEGVLDSLEMIEFLSIIENEFDIKVGIDDLTPENFESIKRISLYISCKKVVASFTQHFVTNPRI